MKKRIIPCLDMKNGRVVKGVQFEGLRDAGDPIELAKRYEQDGADELVFLDISATLEERQTTVDIVRKAAEELSIPFTIGGGIHSMTDIDRLFTAGAGKISMNSAALKHPELIEQGAEKYGRSRIVVAIDAAWEAEDKAWYVYTHGGHQQSFWQAVDWAREAEKRGAGEILLTSKDQDGARSGYDLPLTRAVSEAVAIPVIASGGAGSLDDIYDVFAQTDANAALAASIFHFQETSIPNVQAMLQEKGVMGQ